MILIILLSLVCYIGIGYGVYQVNAGGDSYMSETGRWYYCPKSEEEKQKYRLYSYFWPMVAVGYIAYGLYKSVLALYKGLKVVYADVVFLVKKCLRRLK